MNVSDLTVRLIVLLIPGILAALIVEKLTHHRPWSAFTFALNSVLLGFGSYAFHQLILCVWELKALSSESPYNPKTITFWTSLFDKDTSISLAEVALTCIFAVIIGYLVSASIHHKLVFRIAKQFGVSNKFGDEDVWAYFLNSKDVEWIWVRDHSRGLVYEGWVQLFSVTTTIRELLLREVRVYTNDSSEFLYEVPAMYISRATPDITIQLPIFGEEIFKDGRKSPQTIEGRGTEGSNETTTGDRKAGGSSTFREAREQPKTGRW